MFKIFNITLAGILAASAVTAGPVYVAPMTVAIEEPVRMGGSGAWLIPLLAIGLILLTVNKGSEPGL